MKCNILKCVILRKKIQKMTLKELEYHNHNCLSCGNWIFKKSEVANKTYNKVSNQWAETFMNKILKI